MPAKLVVEGAARSTAWPWTPAILESAGPAGWVGANIIVIALYFLLGSVVNAFFAAYGVFPAPIWLPASVAVVGAMVGGVRMLPGIFFGSFLANAILFAAPLEVAALISVTNALGPVLAILLLQRLRPEYGLFTSMSGLMAFVLCTTLLHPAITALGGATALAIGQPFDLANFYGRFVTWWLTDSGGTLYLAPAAILWLGLETEEDNPANGANLPINRHDVVVWTFIAVLSVVLFLSPPFRGDAIRTVFPFLLVVPVSWVALRMSLRSAYSLVSLVSIFATAGTVAGYGPFQDQSLANPLLLVGTLVVVLATNVLTIVALVSERQRAQDANNAKLMFLANMSHELRTPLNAIIGFSSMIKSEIIGPIPNKEYMEYAALINSSGEHLLALINDLMEMSRIESGRIKLNEEHIPLTRTVEQAMKIVGLQATEKSITLSADMACGNVTIFADAKALRQILLNLLANAVKFTPEGGEVSLAASREGGGDLIITVSDTGIGIPSEALDTIFNPFERVRRGAAQSADGVGLGLSITRGLVALHGATISLESEVGRGTVVTIVFPSGRIIGIGGDADSTDKPTNPLH